MPATSSILRACAVLVVLLTSHSYGQPAPPAAASLQNVTGCSVEGTDVFITTGTGAAARRYKYPWDASIDALCNANGFAVTAPKASTPLTASSPPAPATLLATPAAAQASDGLGFPAGSRKLEAAELTQLISGRVVKTFRLDGNSAGTRVQYDTNGVVYLNSPGGALSGRWRVEGSTVCYTWNRGQVADGCFEVRMAGDRAYARRATGEIVRLEIDK